MDGHKTALAAISAASAAVLNLAEAVRDDDNLAVAIHSSSVSEELADALQSALTIEVDALPDGERRTAIADLLVACGRFLEGWA